MADQWTIDDYNSGALDTDPGKGWSGQDWVDFYNKNRPKSTQSPGGTATTSTAAPAPASPTNQYTGSVDPSLQTVKPASGSLPPSPIPYAASIPLGSTGGSQPAYPTDTSSTTTMAGGVQVPAGTPGAQTTVADDFGTGAPKATQTMDDAVRARLLDLLGTDPNNVSVTDADLAPASRAFNAQVDREAQNQRAQLLEGANQEGTASSGATTTGLDSIGMTAAQSKGANDASLITQKQAQRIQQLQTAISVASSMGMADQANDLQRQLANLQAGVTERGQDVTSVGQQIQVGLANLSSAQQIYLGQLNAQLQEEGYSEQDRLGQLDAEVRKMGIDTQGDLGQLDIALRSELGEGQLNLGLLQTLLGNNQANNSLGFSYTQLQALLNQNAAEFPAGG